MDLTQLNTDLAAAEAALVAVTADVTALATSEPDPSVAVVSSMVTALEAAGYTVTAPATNIPVTDGNEPELPEGSTEDSTNTPSES